MGPEGEELFKALEESEDPRIRRWAEANKELYQWLSGKTPLGFLAWLRWMGFFLPIKAVASGASWGESLLIALALFAVVSAIGPIWRRHKVSELISKIHQLETELDADGSLKAEIEQLGSHIKQG
jgi:hypothetical protein